MKCPLCDTSFFPNSAEEFEKALSDRQLSPGDKFECEECEQLVCIKDDGTGFFIIDGFQIEEDL